MATEMYDHSKSKSYYEEKIQHKVTKSGYNGKEEAKLEVNIPKVLLS
jgi:hypothetical protein